MRALLAVAVAAVLAGCQCGPGVPCASDTACAPWGVCGASGFCVTKAAGSDGGTPKAVVPDTQIDFGRVGCGTTLVRKTITLTNSGTGLLSFSTEVTNSSVYAVAPLVGNLVPDETIEIGVSALVPLATVANADLPATLTITTNDPDKKKIALPVKLKGQGVTLVAGTPTFSSATLSDPSQQLPVQLTNTGNLGATLNFAQPLDPQFALSWPGSDAGQGLFVDAGATAVGLTARFKASKIGASMTTAAITFPDPTCGVTAGVIELRGGGLGGEVTLSDAELTFGAGGRVDCGATAPAKTFTLRNTGNLTFNWIGTLGKGASSPFAVMPTSGVVFGTGDAGVTLTVTPAAIPTTASTTQDAFGDVFTIVTDVPGDPGHAVVLHQTANGAVLSFDAPSVDFGLVPLGDTARAPVRVSNTGNAAAAVSFSASHPKFEFTPAGTTTIDGGTSFGFVATYSPDASIGPEAANVTMVSDGGAVLCGPLPAPLTMSGSGSTGSVSYTPVGLDFGAVNCGTTAAPQAVTFKNQGNQAYTITPSLPDAGSPYLFAMSPASGVVAADGGTLTITVTPKAIPPAAPVTVDLFGDTLTVTTDVAGDPPHLIALKMTARGAIFGISATAINFGSVAVGGVGTSQFTVDNTGNAAGTIGFTPAQPTVFGLPRDAGVPANASLIATGSFTPQGVSMVTDTAAISVSPETVLCQPLPFTTLALSGSGTLSNGLAVSPNNLTFGTAGLTPCGTTAAAKTITVTNNAAVPLNLTFSFGIWDGGSPYTVAGPATLGPGDAGTVTVTPKPMPAASATAPDLYGDTLAIQAAGGPVNETHVVALHQTAQGAILTFNPAALTFSAGLGQTQQKSFTVSNGGNLAAAYTLTLGGTNPGAFMVTPTSSSVNPGSGVTENVTFSGELLSPKRTATISVATGVARCGPLPTPVQLTGN